MFSLTAFKEGSIRHDHYDKKFCQTILKKQSYHLVKTC